MAYSRSDVRPPYTGGPIPGKRLLLTPEEFEVLESLLTPPDTVSTARADNYHRVVASPSSIQLARQRHRRSIEETEAVNRVDSVMASRNRLQARTGGSESVIESISSHPRLECHFSFYCIHITSSENIETVFVIINR